jgi:hypothetical protein
MYEINVPIQELAALSTKSRYTNIQMQITSNLKKNVNNLIKILTGSINNLGVLTIYNQIITCASFPSGSSTVHRLTTEDIVTFVPHIANKFINLPKLTMHLKISQTNMRTFLSSFACRVIQVIIYQ